MATVTYGNLQEIYSYAIGGQVATKTMRYSAYGKSADLVAAYTWSNGRLASVRPPNGHLFTFSYNSMGLPTGQQRVKPDDSIETLFSGGIFDHAGRLTGLTDAQGLPQTRTYDDVGRLTQSRINGGIFDQTYTYATAQDDGRLVSQTDAISGETVAYQYDTLGRLTRAESTGPQWGLAWTYDGFGNRLTQSVVKGSGPAASTPVYPATNRLQDSSIDYDAACNVTRFSMPDSSQRWLTWDALNRMTAAWTGSPHPGGHTEVYTYDTSNQRVMKQRDQDQPVLTYYGIDGKPMGDYTVNWDTTQVWFTGGGWGASVGFFGLENPNRLQSKGDHYPYGEQKGVYTPSFATYTRESFTNLDYAINRYYSAPTGRFISPDPYQASGGAADPGSWNRYGYVEGDPVNFHDPRGLMQEAPTFSITVTVPAMGLGDLEFWWAMTRRNWVADPGGGGRSVPPEPASGGGSGTSREGINLAVGHLNTIAGGSFQSKPRCNEFLAALINIGDLKADVASLAKQLMQAAASATSYIYDGPSSNTILSEDKFAGVASPGVSTVAAWFAANGGAQALSQYNGFAIWIRSSDWAAALGGLVSSSFAGAYGLGTMMHELLHKQTAGGGFSHSQMSTALAQIGMSQGDYSLGHNAISDQIGRICF